MSETEIKPEEKVEEEKETPHTPAEPRELSSYAQEYTKQYQMDWVYQHRAIISPLEVDELASRIAAIYEQVRKVIDWKEENLLRRGAIERILKRRLVSEIYGISILPDLNAAEMAEPMILELMRSGYFDNGKIAKKQIKEIENILNKYIKILDDSNSTRPSDKKMIKNKTEFYTWMLEIAACEVEEVLAPGFKETALINLMTNVIYSRCRILPSTKMDDLERLIQIYIASMRTLYNFDDPIISYNVIKIRYPYWLDEDEASVNKVVSEISDIRKQIDDDINSEEGRHFYKLASKYDAAYRIIGDIVEKINNTPEIVRQKLADPEELKKMVSDAYFKRKKSLKRRLFRSAIYSTLSIFVAGIASFIMFEGPVAKLAGKEFSILSLFVDLLIPSLVMFVLVIFIQPPKDSNLKVVQQEVSKIIHKQRDEDVYEIDFRRHKNKILNGIFIAVSVICGAIGMRGIYWIFDVGNVPWTSMYLDTINVAMVIFAAMAIKSKSREITIEDHVSFIEFILDLFSVPLAKIGQWFSNQWKKYNVFAALFTAIIDLPFSTAIRVIESWREFLKERSSEMH